MRMGKKSTGLPIIAILISCCLIMFFIWARSSIAQSKSEDIPTLALTQDQIDLYISRAAYPGPCLPGYEFKKLLEHAYEPLVYDALIAGVNHSDPRTRLTLIYILFLLRDKPCERLASILDYLQNGNDAERDAAAYALKLFNAEDHLQYMPMLIQAYPVCDAYGRRSLVWSFETATDWPGVLPALLIATQDDAVSVRRQAARVLGWATLHDPSIVHNPDVLDALFNLLDDEDVYVRGNACTSLKSHGANELVIQAFFNVFENDGSELVRGVALNALASFVPSDEIAPTVLEILQGPHSELRGYAIIAAGRIGAYPGFDRALCEILVEGVPIISGVYSALQAIGPEACDTIPTLITIIEQRRGDSNLAIETLAALGPCAQEAIPSIVGILEDGRRHDITAAIIAFGEIGGDTSLFLPYLLDFAREESETGFCAFYEPNFFAVNSLGKLQDCAAEVIPELLILLEENEGTPLAINIQLALYRLVYEPQKNLDAILSALYGEDVYVMERAMWAVGEIGPPAAEALPRLRELIETRYPPSDIIYPWHAAIERIEGSD